MNETANVMLKIEYERCGKNYECYGQMGELRLENFVEGEGNFLCMENNGKVFWFDKEILIFITILQMKKITLLRPRITDYCRIDNK